MSRYKYVLTGPFNNGNASPMTLPVDSKVQARQYVRTDTDYWSRFSDPKGSTYYLYDIADYDETHDQIDGYPYASYTVTNRGIRTENA